MTMTKKNVSQESRGRRKESNASKTKLKDSYYHEKGKNRCRRQKCKNTAAGVRTGGGATSSSSRTTVVGAC